MRLEDVRVGMRVRVSDLSPWWLLHVIADGGDAPMIGQVGTVVDVNPAAGLVVVHFDAWGHEPMLPSELEPVEVQA